MDLWVKPVGRLPDKTLEEGRSNGAHLDMRLKSPWQLFAAWNEEELCGWVGLLLLSETRATVRGWYVREPYRNQGIGTELLATAMSWAWANHYERLEIRTARNVTWAGFQWTGYTRGKGNQEKHYTVELMDRQAKLFYESA